MNAKLSLSKIILLGMALGLMACSDQNRKAPNPIEPDQLMSYLNETLPLISSQSAAEDMGLFLDTDDSLIYYSEGCDECSISARTALVGEDLSFIQPGLLGQDVTHARITFLDYIFEGNHEVGLLIDIWVQPSGSEGYAITKYYIQNTDAELESNQLANYKTLEVELVDTEGTGSPIFIRSNDLSLRDDLKPVVGLKIFQYDPSGQELYVANLPLLVGFE